MSSAQPATSEPALRVLRSVFPDDGVVVDIDDVDARAALLALYQPERAEVVRLNLVSTLDGRAAGADGTSESLTSRLDRFVLGVIRELSDVVLVGAATLRREGYLRPRKAALAVVSASGDLTGHRVEGDAEHPLLVFTTSDGAAAAARSMPSAEIIVVASSRAGRLSVSACIAALRDRGLASIVAEGGPTLAAELLAEGLVDELCLTTMPRVGGPALPLFGTGSLPVIPATPQRLLIADDGVSFGRWDLRN